MSNNTNSSTITSTTSSLSQFLSTLLPCVVVATVKLTIFILIRIRFRRIYEPKTFLGEKHNRVKPLPTSRFGWLLALFRMPKEDLIRVESLDAYFFIRYIYFHGLFFLASFVILASILFPIYIVDGKGKSYNKTGLDLITFGNISPSHSSRYGAPLVLAYVFILSYIYALYRELKIFIEKRQALLRNRVYQASSKARTILIMSIPKEYMSEEILLKMFNRFPGGVKAIWLNRNVDALQNLVDKRQKLISKIELVLCKYVRKSLKKGVDRVERPTVRIGCFGTKVDALDHYKNQIAELNSQIENCQNEIGNSKPNNSAFIQFHDSIAAHMVMQCSLGSIPFAITNRYIDIKSENIIWSNIKLSDHNRRIRTVLVIIVIIALIVFWTIPVSFVGFVSNLNYLTDKLKFLQFTYNLPRTIFGIITGLSASVLLVLLLIIVPVILRFLGRCSGIPTRDSLERFVQTWFFAFQVIQVFLIVTISSSIASVVTLIIQKPTRAAAILAANVPTASNFFLCFIALKCLIIGSILISQLGTLLAFHLLGKVVDNTPRKKSKRYFTLTKFKWGSIYPVFTNYVVITLVYSIIAPLILIVSGITFMFYYVAYVYRLFYVSEFQYDTGGLSFPRAIHQSFTGVYLMEVMLAGLFFAAEDETGAQSAIPEGVLMIILLICTIIIHLTIGSAFDKLTEYLPIDSEEFSQLQTSSVKHIETICENTDREAYLHPCITARKPIVWFPNDRLGLTAGEIQRTQSSGLNIDISMQNAYFTGKNKIEVTSQSPDYIELNDIDTISTRL